MIRWVHFITFLVLFATRPAYAQEHPITQVMQVQEAYDAIPHKRVAFDPQQARSMSPEEAAYLHQLFSLVDMAVVERVETLHWFQHKKGADNQNYDEILHRMDALTVPEKLKPAHKLVTEVLREQKSYFDAWRKNPSTHLSSADPRIRSISNKLRGAYSFYIRTYPNETPNNKSAFYQHLCALDNI